MEKSSRKAETVEYAPGPFAKTFKDGLAQCRPFLMRQAAYLEHRPEIAEDLVQSTLLQGLDKEADFKDGTDVGAMKSWLRTILRNKYFSMVRHAGKGVEIEDEVAHDAMQTATDHRIDQLRTLDQRGAVQRVMKAIGGLPRRQRQAMELTALEKTDKEVAAEMGTVHGTAKTHISRGRKAIIDQLGHEDIDIIQSATNKPLKGTGAENTDNIAL